MIDAAMDSIRQIEIIIKTTMVFDEVIVILILVYSGKDLSFIVILRNKPHNTPNTGIKI